jgi:tetratricopeptide (TPR) repeat protein
MNSADATLIFQCICLTCAILGSAMTNPRRLHVVFPAVVFLGCSCIGQQAKPIDLFEQGSRLFLKGDYQTAIAPYSQALEMEKASPTLGKPLWYVLVDNLGMSYGITGNMPKAMETFRYGLSKDPTYPLFYYNLACGYAEMTDEPKAAENLKKAFQYKANVLQGEQMPDPRTDDSFKELMNNADFRAVVDSLVKT